MWTSRSRRRFIDLGVGSCINGRSSNAGPAQLPVAAELGRTLDFAKVPKREKAEVLAAFAAHKDEVTVGYVAAAKRG